MGSVAEHHEGYAFTNIFFLGCHLSADSLLCVPRLKLGKEYRSCNQPTAVCTCRLSRVVDHFPIHFGKFISIPL